VRRCSLARPTGSSPAYRALLSPTLHAECIRLAELHVKPCCPDWNRQPSLKDILSHAEDGNLPTAYETDLEIRLWFADFFKRRDEFAFEAFQGVREAHRKYHEALDAASRMYVGEAERPTVERRVGAVSESVGQMVENEVERFMVLLREKFPAAIVNGDDGEPILDMSHVHPCQFDDIEDMVVGVMQPGGTPSLPPSEAGPDRSKHRGRRRKPSQARHGTTSDQGSTPLRQ